MSKVSYQFLRTILFSSLYYKTTILCTCSFASFSRIVAVKEIIEKGSRWNVRNGKRVHIWRDWWLPTSESFKVVSLRTTHPNSEMVVSLINLETRSWDVTKVRNTFLPHEAQVILGIPISHRLPNDSLIWAWTPNGKFTVNHAYKVAQKCLQDGQHKTEGGTTLTARVCKLFRS